MKIAYLLAAILGTVVPYAFFGNFMLEHDANLNEFVRQLFANSPASGFTADLLITSTVFWLWSFQESRRMGMRNWWIYVLLNLTVGLSCALPLFLFFRQPRVESLQLPAPSFSVAQSATKSY